MSAPTALAAAPTWALDPESHAANLGDWELLLEMSYEFPSFTFTNVTGWFQVWGKPDGCNISTCTTILTLGYIELEEALPTQYMNADTMQAAMDAIPGGSGITFTDVTAEVPNAVFAYTMNITVGFSMVIGMAVFEGGKKYGYFMSYPGMAIPSSSSSSSGDIGIGLQSAASTSDMTEIMSALGNAFPPGIPGYDLLVMLGLVGAISTLVIVKKKKSMK